MRSRRGAARFPPTRPTSWRLYLDYQWPARVYQETRTRLEEIDQGFLEIGIRIRDYGYVYFRCPKTAGRLTRLNHFAD